MGDRIAMRREAEAIADAALAAQRTSEGSAGSYTEALAAVLAQASESQQRLSLRELTLFEKEPARVGHLLDLLLQGGYRDQAADAAGITARSLRAWMQKAADGDLRYQAIARAVTMAEAIGENRHVATIARHSQKEWCAAAWLLERKYPERWGKRQEDTGAPRVTITLGIDIANGTFASQQALDDDRSSNG